MSKTIEVLITLPFNENLLSQLREVSPRLNITVSKARKPEEVPAEVWGRTEVLYTNTVIPALEQAPNLRWIQFHWAGLDHILDHPVLEKSNLAITSLSGASVTQSAEFTLTMLLALGHRLPDLSAHQKRAEWPAARWEHFRPIELRGSTVGIVGYGSIGRQIARLLSAFGARVLATKRDAMHTEDKDYSPEGLGDPSGDLVHRIYPPQALRSMFKESDFVVISLPLTKETRGMIGAAELAALKPEAYLIDISRGGIVDHDALIAALKERKFAGAALDVFPEEPLPSDSPLWKLPNVILTPHISGFSYAYDERAVDLFAENLTRYLADLPLYNRFNPERGY